MEGRRKVSDGEGSYFLLYFFVVRRVWGTGGI